MLLVLFENWRYCTIKSTIKMMNNYIGDGQRAVEEIEATNNANRK